MAEDSVVLWASMAIICQTLKTPLLAGVLAYQPKPNI